MPLPTVLATVATTPILRLDEALVLHRMAMSNDEFTQTNVTQSNEARRKYSVSPMSLTRWESVLYGGLFCLGIAALWVVFWFPPTEHPFYPRCAFHDVTGLHCPGCGGFRAWHDLLHGRLLSALRMNALAVTLLPGLLIWLFLQRILRLRGDFWTLQASPSIQILLALTVLVFGLVRNIPWGPFRWFAP